MYASRKHLVSIKGGGKGRIVVFVMWSDWQMSFLLILQLNTVLESLLSKIARYDQGTILAPMFSLRVSVK